MPVSKKNADLIERFYNNPKALALLHLTESLEKNKLEPVLKALNEILVGQNISAVARKAGINKIDALRFLRRKGQPLSWARAGFR